MWIGHFAAGYAFKARVPKAPLAALLIGIGFLDYLFSLFVALKLEIVSKHGLEFIDWSHSLTMSVIWSLAFGALFYKLGWKVSFTIGAAVFSHFVLDLMVHDPDLTFYPHGAQHFGFGPWLSQFDKTARWALELLVIGCCLWYYLYKMGKMQLTTKYSVIACIVLISLHCVRFFSGL